MYSGKFNNMLLGMLLASPLAVAASPSYNAALTLSSLRPTVGGTDNAKVTLTSTGDAAASAGIVINMPSGFSAMNFSSTCGGTISPSGTTQLTLSGATVPVGATCSYTFTLNVPQVAFLPPSNARSFTIAASSAPGLAPLTGSSAPTLTGFNGATPGLYSSLSFPSSVKNIATLDMFITPMTNPGPNSNVFYSNQMYGISGYTGMQTTELTSATEGTGRQFLFSVWGATNARPGTPASVGIGAGSFCTVSGSATDGSAGAQCRYRYEWKTAHTYRFRVTPDANLGAGWFKSNVTDVTGGAEGDSFDVGSIYVGTNQTTVPVTGVTHFTEYFDWNSSRTSCASVSYSNVKFSVTAYDSLGNVIALPAPSAYANKSCPSTYTQTTVSGDVANLIGGLHQTAAGLFKASGSCLTAQAGLTDGNPPGSNHATLSACPTSATVHAAGGTAFNNQLWVAAGDGTIETKYSYCLTDALPNDNGAIVSTCVPGAANQQWSVIPGQQAGQTQLLSKVSNRCLAPGVGGVLGLQPCSASTAVWVTPGHSFAY